MPEKLAFANSLSFFNSFFRSNFSSFNRFPSPELCPVRVASAVGELVIWVTFRPGGEPGLSTGTTVAVMALYGPAMDAVVSLLPNSASGLKGMTDRPVFG